MAKNIAELVHNEVHITTKSVKWLKWINYKEYLGNMIPKKSWVQKEVEGGWRLGNTGPWDMYKNKKGRQIIEQKFLPFSSKFI